MERVNGAMQLKYYEILVKSIEDPDTKVCQKIFLICHGINGVWVKGMVAFLPWMP
jgi:hypothetical protein